MHSFRLAHILPEVEAPMSKFWLEHHVAQSNVKEVEYQMEMEFPVPKIWLQLKLERINPFRKNFEDANSECFKDKSIKNAF